MIRTRFLVCTFFLSMIVLSTSSLTFARERIATPGNAAQTEFDAALSRAKASNKALSVHFSATWCGICKIYDRLYDDPVAKPIFDKHQIMIKIDFEKTPGGRDLYERMDHNESVPAYTLYDPKGNWAANSNATTRKTGNIGFPMDDDEVAHYEKSLRAAFTGASTQEIKTILARAKAIYEEKRAKQ
jgi:thiol-disulfide isomerase/thioredoxin